MGGTISGTHNSLCARLCLVCIVVRATAAATGAAGLPLASANATLDSGKKSRRLRLFVCSSLARPCYSLPRRSLLCYIHRNVYIG
jgi:hypothetical protein